MKTKQRGTIISSSVLLMILGGVLLLAVGIWSVLQKPAASAPPVGEIEERQSESDLPYPEVERATVDEVKAAYDDGSALIVDVRHESDYLEGHIQNAISLPLTELGSWFSELPQDQMIYLYCT